MDIVAAGPSTSSAAETAVLLIGRIVAARAICSVAGALPAYKGIYKGVPAVCPMIHAQPLAMLMHLGSQVTTA